MARAKQVNLRQETDKGIDIFDQKDLHAAISKQEAIVRHLMDLASDECSEKVALCCVVVFEGLYFTG